MTCQRLQILDAVELAMPVTQTRQSAMEVSSARSVPREASAAHTSLYQKAAATARHPKAMPRLQIPQPLLLPQRLSDFERLLLRLLPI